MTELFNNILSNVSSNLTVGIALVTLTVAILFGIFVAFTYYKIQDDASYQQSLAITLVILPGNSFYHYFVYGEQYRPCFQPCRSSFHYSIPQRSRRPEGYWIYLF